MNQMQFSVEIYASKQIVWDTLWQDKTFREWAGIIDPGTHMVGDFVEGKEVQYISGNGYGVTSLVAKLIDCEFVLLKHKADTQDSGERAREDEWTGGEESYALEEKDGVTTLTARFDVPPEMEEYFTQNYPKALNKVKELSETTNN